MSRQKNNGKQDHTSKILLATVIIQLIQSLKEEFYLLTSGLSVRPKR